MKYISITFVFLLLLEISPFSVAFAENKEKVIVISERVGEVIDAEERERFGLWPEIKGFKSAVFLQLSDGSYVADITYEEDGEEKKSGIPQSELSIASLKEYIENYDETESQHYVPDVEEEKVVKPSMQNMVKPPTNSGKIIREIFFGIGAGTLVGIGGSFIGASIMDSENHEGFGESVGAFVGFAIVYPIGSAIGVYSFGNIGNETGSFAITLGGSIIGVAVGIGALYANYWHIAALCPPIGATIGFNATRRYKNLPPPETGLINFRNSKMSFAVPLIYYTQKNTFEGKTITQNVTLIKISF